MEKIKFTNIKDVINYKNYGNGRLFGFELEVEKDTNLSNEELINIIGKNREWLYFMEEPSLIDGFEIISHPCSIEFLKDNLPKLLEELSKLGLKSYYTAGLHFHVSREVFGTKEEQPIKIGNLIQLIHNNFAYIKDKCGREIDTKYSKNWKLKKTVQQLNEENPLFLGSNKNTNNIQYTKAILKKDYSTPKGREEVRNKPINLLKKKTVEFRLPQSTLDYNTFMDRLNLYNDLINLALADLPFQK